MAEDPRLARAYQLAQAIVTSHYADHSHIPDWKVGDRKTLHQACAFLPAHKDLDQDLYYFATLDPWTALRGSEGEPEHYAVVQKDSKVEVLEIKTEILNYDHDSDSELTEEEEKLISEVVPITAPVYTVEELKILEKDPYHHFPRPRPDFSKMTEAELAEHQKEVFHRYDQERAYHKKYPVHGTKILSSVILPRGARMRPYTLREDALFRRLHVRLHQDPTSYFAKVRVTKPVLAPPGEDVGSYDPLGFSVPRQATFPVADPPDYTGGYINHVTEGWISLGSAYPDGEPKYDWQVLGEPANDEEEYFLEESYLKWVRKFREKGDADSEDDDDSEPEDDPEDDPEDNDSQSKAEEALG